MDIFDFIFLKLNISKHQNIIWIQRWGLRVTHWNIKKNLNDDYQRCSKQSRGIKKKHTKISNKGEPSREKERFEWITSLAHTTDEGRRSQGQPDFHHPVYWLWAEMSKGIKLTGGKIKSMHYALCTFFIIQKSASCYEWRSLWNYCSLSFSIQ